MTAEPSTFVTNSTYLEVPPLEHLSSPCPYCGRQPKAEFVFRACDSGITMQVILTKDE